MGAERQMTMAAQGRLRGRAIGSTLVVIGALLWLAAWFLPAASLEGSSHSDSLLKGGPESGTCGFLAFLWAASIVPEALGRAEFDMAILGGTCATNFVMMAALILHRFVPWGRALGFAVLACALLNTTWLFLGEAGMAAALRAGYYAWLASFVVTGFGIVAAKPRS